LAKYYKNAKHHTYLFLHLEPLEQKKYSAKLPVWGNYTVTQI